MASDITQVIMSKLLDRVSVELDAEFVSPQQQATALSLLKYLNVKPAATDTSKVEELRDKISRNKEAHKKLRLVKEEQAELDKFEGVV